MKTDLVAALREIAAQFSPAALASSLSVEDMVITDAIVRSGLPIGVFVLDTGRLHADTLLLVDKIRGHYGIEVAVYPYDGVRSTGALILIDEATNHTVAAGLVR